MWIYWHPVLEPRSKPRNKRKSNTFINKKSEPVKGSQLRRKMNKFERIPYSQYVKDFDECLRTYDVVDYRDICIPRRATKYSAGYDFYMPYTVTLAAGASAKIPTGIRVALDADKFLAVVPRSGLGFKYKLQLDNTIGVIDADYYSADNYGHIWIKITNDNREDKTLTLHKGEALAQGIILQYFTTDNDNADGVRTGGLGSTSKEQN